MKSLEAKTEKEIQLVYRMIALYCRKKHHSKAVLCYECNSLALYAKERSQNCPYMKNKTFCSSCKSHCYRKDMRDRIRIVMKFSGKRMLFYDPLNAIRHMAARIMAKTS